MAKTGGSELAGILTKNRFAELVRADLPVNPVSVEEIQGANLNRLKAAMASYGWRDPRFVSAVDAQRRGWAVDENAPSVQIVVPNRANRSQVANVTLYNAQFVRGMPSLEAMLGMTDLDLSRMQQGAAVVDRAQAPSDEVQIGPVRVEKKLNLGDGTEAGIGGVEPAPERGPSGRYAVMVPYWLDQMYNAEGIAIATELNEVVRESGLERNPEAIARLLEGRDRAWMFEAKVVPEEELLNDPHWREDRARPKTLLGGALVRDAEGAYRPRAGGRAVVEDKGDSLVAKGKSLETVKAAVELAKLKGWTSIELSGDQAKMGDWWLEAKMAGLEVVNYSPSLEDEKRLAERMAVEMPAPQAEKSAPEQTPEIVEMRPYIDAAGQQKMATVVYTVTQEGKPDMQVGSAKEAAEIFAKAPIATAPAVVRSVVRADGQVETDVMVAGTGPGKTAGMLAKSADAAIDAEFSEALAEVLQVEKNQADLGKADTPAPQLFSGMILRIEGNQVIQKVGRDPSQIKKHDIATLSRVPKIGDVVDIAVGKDGLGIVAEEGQVLER